MGTKTGESGDGVMPKRIQRKRTKGWKAPEGAINCTRPGKWGNPWKVAAWMTAENASKNFRGLIAARDEGRVYDNGGHPAGITSADIRRELRGKDLMCWCGLDEPCHVDVLLEIANAPEARG